LRRYHIFIHIGEICGLYLRLGAIYAVVGVPLYLLMGQLPLGNTLKLFVVLLVSLVGYLGLARLLNITEVGTAFGLFFRIKRSESA